MQAPSVEGRLLPNDGAHYKRAQPDGPAKNTIANGDKLTQAQETSISTLSGLDRHVLDADHLNLPPAGRTLEAHLITLTGTDQGPRQR